jgi:hypothetical protein
MASQSYERLSIEDFGAHLLNSGDLDPIYMMLHNVGHDFDDPQMYRWLVAYWCFYHAGVASYLSEFRGWGFWKKMMEAGVNETPTPLGGRWPRASERRHFRGFQAINAIQELEDEYGDSPESMVVYLSQCHGVPLDYQTVARRVKTHRGFGDWISFKVADMLDRVLQVPVSFDQAEVFMFKDPRKSALMQYRLRHNITDPEEPIDEPAAIREVVGYLIDHFSGTAAPPLWDRPVGLQEVETILCKWKSHSRGHYPLNNDCEEIRHGLEEWSKVTKVAKLLAAFVPNAGD